MPRASKKTLLWPPERLASKRLQMPGPRNPGSWPSQAWSPEMLAQQTWPLEQATPGVWWPDWAWLPEKVAQPVRLAALLVRPGHLLVRPGLVWEQREEHPAAGPPRWRHLRSLDN